MNNIQIKSLYDKFTALPTNLQRAILGLDLELSGNILVAEHVAQAEEIKSEGAPRRPQPFTSLIQRSRNSIFIDTHPILSKLSRASFITHKYQLNELYSHLRLINAMVHLEVTQEEQTPLVGDQLHMRRMATLPLEEADSISLGDLLAAAEEISQESLLSYAVIRNDAPLLHQFDLESCNPYFLFENTLYALALGRMDLYKELAPNSTLGEAFLEVEDSRWTRCIAFFFAYECGQFAAYNELICQEPPLAPHIIMGFVNYDIGDNEKLRQFLQLFSSKEIAISADTVQTCIERAAVDNKRDALANFFRQWTDAETVPLEFLQHLIEMLKGQNLILPEDSFLLEALHRHPDRALMIQQLNHEIERRYGAESVVPETPATLPAIPGWEND